MLLRTSNFFVLLAIVFQNLIANAIRESRVMVECV
jgi:hypothetical protein